MKTSSAKTVFILLMLLFLAACASAPPQQTAEEWSVLKSPLIEGEYIIRGNSCSQVPKATFLGGGKAEFGSAFLTNLRFIYEESEWAKNLRIASKFVPTSGDFGLGTVLSGAYEALKSNYIIKMGQGGKLAVARKQGRIMIPLSVVKEVRVVEGLGATGMADRWIEIDVGAEKPFIYEIYDLPPNKTGTFPTYVSRQWSELIMATKAQSYGK